MSVPINPFRIEYLNLLKKTSMVVEELTRGYGVSGKVDFHYRDSLLSGAL